MKVTVTTKCGCGAKTAWGLPCAACFAVIARVWLTPKPVALTPAVAAVLKG